MTDVITVEMRDADGRKYWLVAVGAGGMTRPMARCEYPGMAEIVVEALRELPPERLADVQERVAVAAKRAPRLITSSAASS